MSAIEIKTDSVGDTFVSGYNKYLKEATSERSTNHLNQLIRNYESAFGEYPTPEYLNSALKFASLFCAEVMEMYPRTHYARCASDLNTLIGDDAVETAESLSELNNL